MSDVERFKLEQLRAERGELVTKIHELDRKIGDLLDEPIRVEANLTTEWHFEVMVPRRDVKAPGFDPVAALEAAYSDGADWGDLLDHDIPADSVWVDGEPIVTDESSESSA